jgi:hypothetical protein
MRELETVGRRFRANNPVDALAPDSAYQVLLLRYTPAEQNQTANLIIHFTVVLINLTQMQCSLGELREHFVHRCGWG